MAELSGKVIPVAIEDEIRDSYLTYAMSVIVSRALPDVRDGLKPVHRRLLYAMDEMGLRPNRPYKKTARLVGDVLGKYHPHGDQALYDALVRLAQDFSLRYPLVDGQGNFGSVDGDPPAAMRYTEARLAPVSEEMLRDLGKETVDFVPNYDDSLTEPSVLPGAFPFLLANGGSGIAVGMATNIPPHNLREVAAGIVALIDNPQLTDAGLMKHIIGPDFPTGGIIFGRRGIEDAYTTGKGKVIVRGRATFETVRSGRQAIIITEIPYQVNKANLIIRIADLAKEHRLEGIADLRDESDRQGMRIVIEVRRRVDPRIILNKLFSLTQLQDSFGVNMLALDGGRPVVLTLRDIASRFIDHRREVVVRRSKYDLRKAEEREHILEGLKIALDNIDAVIKLIRESRTVEAARSGLRKSFQLSVLQAQAILNMQLQRLTSLEVKKVVDELAQVRAIIKDLRELLASPQGILAVVKRETNRIAAAYGDDRRTEVIETEVEEFNYEDLIEEEDMVVLISNRGIVKRIPATNYRRQSRGGKGSGSNLRAEDFITKLFIGSTHDHILFITSAGKAYWLKVHELPERTRQTIGVDIRSLVAMEDDEQATAVVSLTEFRNDQYVFMATAGGVVKKVRTADFSNAKTRGIAAIKLDAGDRLISAMLTDGSQDVVLVSSRGKALRFREQSVRAMGRASRGVTGLRLQPKDRLVAALPVEPRKGMVLMSERGFGKRMEFSVLTPHGRGTAGQLCYRCDDRTGGVVGAITMVKSDDVVCITEKGQTVKVRQRDLPTLGRTAQGVKVVAIAKDDSALGLASVAKEV